jgi:glycerophosphoryl diester phosphodiesterase
MKKKYKYLIALIIFVIGVSISIFCYWNSQPYYKKYHYIAHALGGIDGQDYSNSQEALEYAYSNGTRLMEVDFMFTSDNRLVCRHKWSDDMGDELSEEDIPDYQTFMSSKIYGAYTPLDIETIIRFAMNHPDVYFITDVKSYKEDMYEMLEVISETSQLLGFTEYDKRFIIQFYNYENYQQIKDDFNFQNYIFTLYRMKSEIKKNGVDIKVITMPENYLTKEISSKLKENDLALYVHTINSRKSWVKLMIMGVNGIYTDYITPVSMLLLVVKGLVSGTAMILLLLGSIFGIKKIRNRNNK